MKKAQIISNPKILGGKPVIAGTRISVELILDKISAGMSEKEILQDYPHLTSKQIQTAVAYAKKIVAQKKGIDAARRKEIPPIILYTHEISR
ncbi:DUF433 domain-containing protein [Candidatus Daviesbacteria bacterium]|nr:DUF433 domain-containing protein [Candidatus Daviesbacteria bacterium]